MRGHRRGLHLLLVAVVVAALLLVLSTCLVRFARPQPPLEEDRLARSKIEQSLLEQIGADYALEASMSPLTYSPPDLYFIYPVGATWMRDVTAVARSRSVPEFAAYMYFQLETVDPGESGSYAPDEGELALSTRWVRTLRGMADARRQSFMIWWVEFASVESGVGGVTPLLVDILPAEYFGGVLPQSVSLDDVYEVTYTTSEMTPLWGPSLYVGWDAAAQKWVTLEW